VLAKGFNLSLSWRGPAVHPPVTREMKIDGSSDCRKEAQIECGAACACFRGLLKLEGFFRYF
jgi:hypothetical protein